MTPWHPFFKAAKHPAPPDAAQRLAHIQELAGRPFPPALCQFLLEAQHLQLLPCFLYLQVAGQWRRYSPSHFLSLETTEHILQAGHLSPHLVPLATDEGGDYLFAATGGAGKSPPPFSLHVMDHEDPDDRLLYAAPSLPAFFSLLNPDDGGADLDAVQAAVDANDVAALEKLIGSGRWRVDEVFKYGNTVADMLLMDRNRSSRPMLRMLLRHGARVPRFGAYAHHSMDEAEIVHFLRTGRLQDEHLP